jgi:hypothetical protein
MDKNDYLCDISESRDLDLCCERTPFEEKPEPQQRFIAIWSLESDVNNGGFLQYFGNSMGGTAAFAADALKDIGAPNLAAIVERAVSLAFPNRVPSDWDERGEIVDEIEEGDDELIMKFEALDEAFYEYPDDLVELLFDFVQKHPEHFPSG